MQVPMTIAADSQQIANYVETVSDGRARGLVGMAMSGDPEQFRRGLTYSEFTRKIATVEVLLTATPRKEWLARNARRPR
jgi:hypothetical protein